MLIKAGLSLSHIEEWGPSAADLVARPELAEELERPMMLLVAAQRPTL
jgi:hypothetical protein